MNYFAQVNMFLLLLYGCYWLLLRRHTFFAWNRAYLLGSLLLAFVLPLVPYPDFAPNIALPSLFAEYDLTPPAEVAAPELAEAEQGIVTTTTPESSEASGPAAPGRGLVAWLMVGYVLGVVFMAGRLIRQLRRLSTFIQQTEALDMGAYHLHLLGEASLDEAAPDVSTPDEASPGSFSFLKSVVITRRDYEENFDTILCHELAHVRQRHSWDVLLVEVLRVFFWFNPVLVFYKKSLQQVHEYLADREVCAWNAAPGAAAPRDRYAEFMLSYARATPKAVGLTNPFLNASLLKNRIIMLYKTKNSNWALGKYAAAAMIIVFVSLMSASCKQKADEKSKTVEAIPEDNQDLLVEGKVTDAAGMPLSGATVVIKGTQMGTITTDQGQYRVFVPVGGELDFNFMGYKTASAKIKQQGTVEVVMVEKRADKPSEAQWVSADTGQVHIVLYGKTQLLPNYITDPVFTVVRTNPKFAGGLNAMYKFIQDNIEYPAAARRADVSGKVFLTFVVLADGSITQIKVLKGMGFGTDEEAIRVVSAMPKWKPGMNTEGEKVNVKFNLPITFDLPKS